MDPATTGGMMIYNNPLSGANSEGVQITGNSAGTVNLSAMTDGPYQGIMIWQNRSAPQTMSLQGNGLFNMTGTLYAAGALLSITGNGGQYAAADGTIGSGSAIGSQYISLDLNIGGNGNIHLAYPGQTAPTRILTLVE
jgi:hypothetical protein